MATVVDAPSELTFVSLEITGRCQLRCEHCYADSGPHGDSGTMTATDWRRVLDEAAALGVRDVQFIGGEPTLHPELPELVRHALKLDLNVEVYTNLVSVKPELWDVLELPGVRIGTSYYSPDAGEHDTITTRRSHDRTLANIREAARRGIPIRVGVIRVRDHQDVDGAVAQLSALGVSRVETDDVRRIGRATRDRAQDAGQLCGRCNDGKLGVLASGDVVPCVLSRWVILGNVCRRPLTEIYHESATDRRQLIARWATLVSMGDDDKDKPKPKDDDCQPPKSDSPVCQAPTCLPPHYY